jgi:Zn-dependent M16 (insulinase) family peptidase
MMHQQMVFVGAGHRFASLRASAMATGRGAAEEALYGSTFIQWVKNQCAADDEALKALAAQLKAIAKKAFCVKRMTVGVSDNAEELADAVIAAFPAGEAAGEANFAPMAGTQVGLPIPAPIGFAAKASDILNHGGTFTGSTYVLANILRFSYLWNEIRVLGGAYGMGLIVRPDGDVQYMTYRDPNPARSLKKIAETGAALRKFCESGNDIGKYVVSAIGKTEPYLSPRLETQRASELVLSGRTPADLERLRAEILATGKADIEHFTLAFGTDGQRHAKHHFDMRIEALGVPKRQTRPYQHAPEGALKVKVRNILQIALLDKANAQRARLVKHGQGKF